MILPQFSLFFRIFDYFPLVHVHPSSTCTLNISNENPDTDIFLPIYEAVGVIMVMGMGNFKSILHSFILGSNYNQLKDEKIPVLVLYYLVSIIL